MPKDGLLLMKFIRSLARRISLRKRSISFLASLLLFAKGWSIDYDPWLPPLFEIDTQFFYCFREINQLKTQSGKISYPNKHHTLGTTIGVTPWPYWNIEAEVFFTHSNQIPFSYEASRYAVRYNWFDDLDGNLFALTTGAILTFPNKRFLEDRTFLYHGQSEFEFYLSFGKEWPCNSERIYRLWAMAAAGFAPRSRPWFHGLSSLECHFSTALLAFFIETFCGFGSQNLEIRGPFLGYGYINYQKLNAGLKAALSIAGLGQFSLKGWYNLSSQNTTYHDWAIQLSLDTSFALF